MCEYSGRPTEIFGGKQRCWYEITAYGRGRYVGGYGESRRKSCEMSETGGKDRETPEWAKSAARSEKKERLVMFWFGGSRSINSNSN